MILNKNYKRASKITKMINHHRAFSQKCCIDPNYGIIGNQISTNSSFKN